VISKTTFNDKSELPELANQIILKFPDIRIFLFKAEMGVGKTTFIKEIAKVLGVNDTMSSPTYSIVNEYQLENGKIFHFDLYRVKSFDECLDIGMDEYLNSGNYCFIEWPEIANPLYPENHIVIKITTENQFRIFEILNGNF
jgi:tRNA threonylcarbamoyladenosine biosynthesis protein TsaE